MRHGQESLIWREAGGAFRAVLIAPVLLWPPLPLLRKPKKGVEAAAAAAWNISGARPIRLRRVASKSRRLGIRGCRLVPAWRAKELTGGQREGSSEVQLPRARVCDD